MKLQIGKSYKTTWQSDKAMLFTLAEIDGKSARLETRFKSFWTTTASLIETDAKKPKWKRRLDKKQKREQLTEYWAENYIDENPQRTAEITKLLRDEKIPY